MHENEQAIFEKVQEIPYQQLTQTQQGGSIGTTAFKNVGIELHVTPKIAAEGIIRMTVNPKVSRLVGFTPGDNQPIIDTSSASTVLSIANRQTVVIGGLRQRGDVGKFNGIPYLKDLNVVGRLFRSHDTTVRESELVVFISPEIISYSDEPNCRQKIAAETIRCRLDQIPEAEGCPPCCRRLPLGATDGTLPEPTPSRARRQPAGSQQLPPDTQAKPNDSAAGSASYSRRTVRRPHSHPIRRIPIRRRWPQRASLAIWSAMAACAACRVVPIETRLAVSADRRKGHLCRAASGRPVGHADRQQSAPHSRTRRQRFHLALVLDRSYRHDRHNRPFG